jgi:GntR family transcriptional regulator
MTLTISVDRNSPMPIFRQIEDFILTGIRSGTIRPGDRIPSQYEIAHECQVSRATVQKAIDRLVMDQVLFHQPGKGIFVAAPTERQRLPLLQSFSQSLQALGHQVNADLLLTEQTLTTPQIAETLSLLPDAQVIRIQRLQYVNRQPMMLQVVYLEAERFQGVLARDLRRESLTAIIQEVGQTTIAGSTIAIESSVANWEEARTLNVQAGNPLLTIEEVDYEASGRPIRFSRNKFRGDRFRAVATTMQEREIVLEYRLPPDTVSIPLL